MKVKTNNLFYFNGLKMFNTLSIETIDLIILHNLNEFCLYNCERLCYTCIYIVLYYIQLQLPYKNNIYVAFLALKPFWHYGIIAHETSN